LNHSRSVSIAEEARGRRGPRRGRSSALARSIGLDQPKKRGRGGGSNLAGVQQSRGRAASRKFDFANAQSEHKGAPAATYPFCSQTGVGGGRGEVGGGRASVPGGRASDGRGRDRP